METIKSAVSIDKRPLIVETKKRFGDWEIGKRLSNYILAIPRQ
ncbi:hypothetical protein [Marinomonas mediterranea]|nr:hypothetical protein [Marinomonas mediterranea]